MPEPQKPYNVEENFDILEILTQDYFTNICAQLSSDKVIYPVAADTIRRVLGPVTFNQFLEYVRAQGEYEVRYNG